MKSIGVALVAQNSQEYFSALSQISGLLQPNMTVYCVSGSENSLFEHGLFKALKMNYWKNLSGHERANTLEAKQSNYMRQGFNIQIEKLNSTLLKDQREPETSQTILFDLLTDESVEDAFDEALVCYPNFFNNFWSNVLFKATQRIGKADEVNTATLFTMAE
jgi:hypothetical protein